MTSSDDDLLAGITNLTPQLLMTMEAFEQVQRNMHPTRIDDLADFIKPFETALNEVTEPFQALSFPDHVAKFATHLSEAATYSLRACQGITQADGDTMNTMRAMRAQVRAQEKLYPVANVLKPISQYFLEMPKREDAALLAALAEDKPDGEAGVLHAANERQSRGGFSMYIPEYLDSSQPVPLVVTLHGGTGHGADFIWSWVREARTRGFMVLAPTSQQDTWSLMGEEHDLPTLIATIDLLSQSFAIDREHILLTGMSDGGTYSLLAGLQEASPFTHLAPFSGVLHPEITMNGNIAYARDKPIYLVHGTHDWMFPVEMAQMAEAELNAAGAELTCRIIDGLSHTYARTENAAVLDWFCPALALR